MKNIFKVNPVIKLNILASIGAFACIFCLAYLNSHDPSIVWLIPPFGDNHGSGHGCS